MPSRQLLLLAVGVLACLSSGTSFIVSTKQIYFIIIWSFAFVSFAGSAQDSNTSVAELSVFPYCVCTKSSYKCNVSPYRLSPPTTTVNGGITDICFTMSYVGHVEFSLPDEVE